MLSERGVESEVSDSDNRSQKVVTVPNCWRRECNKIWVSTQKGWQEAWVETLLGLLLHALAWRSAVCPASGKPWAGGRHLQSFFFPSPGGSSGVRVPVLACGWRVWGERGVQQWGFGICPFAQASGQVLGGKWIWDGQPGTLAKALDQGRRPCCRTVDRCSRTGVGLSSWLLSLLAGANHWTCSVG